MLVLSRKKTSLCASLRYNGPRRIKEVLTLPKCVVKFQDGNYCNLEADYLVIQDECVQVWLGEQRLVGIFRLSEIFAIYLTEKLEKGTKV